MRARRWAAGSAIVAALLACVPGPALQAKTGGTTQPSGMKSAGRTSTRPLPRGSRPAPDSLYVRELVRWLSDPKRQGRGPGTAGLDSSATYLAREMKKIGLEPAGDDHGYLQWMEVTTGAEAKAPSGLDARGRRFDLGDDVQPLGFSSNGTVTAPVVFAGYGITAAGYDYDDYAGLDVRDKLVLVLTNEPGEMDSTSRFDGTVNTPHAELRTKAINAREHGAIGMLVANGPRHHGGEPLRKPRPDGAGYMTSGLIAAQLSDAAVAALLAGSGTTLATLQNAIESHQRPHSLALPETVTVRVSLERKRAKIANVVGSIPGRDTARTLVIGAHYDHLGLGNESSLSPDIHQAHVGADDNASGTAALLAAARRIAARRSTGWRPEHTMLFAAFTGEEMGLVGSGHFVDDPPRPLPTVEAMINMDMVGRLRDNRLMIMGEGTAAEFPDLIRNVNAGPGAGFTIRTSQDGYGPSDHSSFYKRQVPVLMLFTGAHADYHRPSDTWDKVNLSGVARVGRFAATLAESLDARSRVTYTKARGDSGSVGRIAGGGGYGAYLGTIPDYLQTEGGVLLSGVRNGSPAEQAGLKSGDVIVRFDDIAIGNIYDYTFALRSRKPGQKVRIAVKRGGGEQELVATLGRRQ